jgi:hypothetical protein
MDPRDRRLLKWIAVSTTFLAVVVALALLGSLLALVLVDTGGRAGRVIERGPNGLATTFKARTTP